MEKTLADLVVGDEVGVYRNGKLLDVVRIGRSTSTLWVLENGWKFKRKDGDEYGSFGDVFMRAHIQIIGDAERMFSAKRQALRRFGVLTGWDRHLRLSPEALNAVCDLLESELKKVEGNG